MIGESLLQRIEPVQSAIDEAYIMAARCGRKEDEETPPELKARKEFYYIAMELQPYASKEARQKIINEQIKLDTARLNNRTLNKLKPEDSGALTDGLPTDKN